MSDDGCDFYVKELMEKKKYFMFLWKMKRSWTRQRLYAACFGVQLQQGSKFHRDNNKQVPSFRKMKSPAMSVKAVRKM